MTEPVSESVHVVPGGPLAGMVVACDGYRQRGVTPARHLGLPSPYVTMIVTLDEPLTLLRRVDSSQPPASFRTLIGGLHRTPVVISHNGAQSGIQVSISPLASRSLFGMPAGELAHLDIEGEAVIGRAATQLWNHIGASQDWSGRIAALESLLARLMPATGQVAVGTPAPVSAAWAHLVASSGQITVAALAREVGWSERQLEKRFTRELGLTPKQAARVIRFDHARRILQRQTRSPTAGSRPASSLARIAADCGYHDQSHLIREFRAFTGLAPSQWLAQEFGNVQAGRPVAA